MGEVRDAYAGCRQRLGALARQLDDDAARRAVPTCPSWTVKDVFAHCSGVVDDALAGRLEGAPGEAWTSAQVASRADRSLREVVEEWDALAPGFEALLDDLGPPGRQAVLDVVSHEHDVRGALGRPGGRDSDAVLVGLGFLVPGFLASVTARGTSLQVTSAGLTWGPDDAALRLDVAPFELLRAATGRRSVEQLRALPWRGDAEPPLAAFTYGPFVPRPEPLEE